jgi:hypothetical protein
VPDLIERAAELLGPLEAAAVNAAFAHLRPDLVVEEVDTYDNALHIGWKFVHARAHVREDAVEHDRTVVPVRHLDPCCALLKIFILHNNVV